MKTIFTFILASTLGAAVGCSKNDLKKNTASELANSAAPSVQAPSNADVAKGGEKKNGTQTESTTSSTVEVEAMSEELKALLAGADGKARTIERDQGKPEEAPKPPAVQECSAPVAKVTDQRVPRYFICHFVAKRSNADGQKQFLQNQQTGGNIVGPGPSILKEDESQICEAYPNDNHAQCQADATRSLGISAIVHPSQVAASGDGIHFSCIKNTEGKTVAAVRTQEQSRCAAPSAQPSPATQPAPQRRGW